MAKLQQENSLQMTDSDTAPGRVQKMKAMLETKIETEESKKSRKKTTTHDKV